MQEKHLLCMYSGGLDSVSALYVILNDERYTEYTIHVHHLHLQNAEKRHLAEAVAVEHTLEWLDHHYPNRLIYTESTHEYLFLENDLFTDLEMILFMSAQIVLKDPRIKGVIRGMTQSDFGGGQNYLDRRKRGEDLYQAILQFAKEIPSFILPLSEMTKKDVWHTLPEELRNRTWSCRTPIYSDTHVFPCKRCKTCKELMAFGALS